MTEYWNIQVFDGVALLYEGKIPCSQIGSRKLDALLVMLAAKHGLDDDIVSSHANKGTRRHSKQPDVKSAINPNDTSTVTCLAGQAHGIATLVDDDINPVIFPSRC